MTNGYEVIIHTTSGVLRNRWIISRQASDATGPTLTTPAKQRPVRLGPAVTVTSGCVEKCSLRATGTIKVKGKTLRLGKVRQQARPGRKVRLTLRLSPGVARTLVALHAKKGVATIKVTASDGKNKTTEVLTVKLR